MNLNNAQLSHVYARQLICTLRDSGISGICVSPGFRNSPLILAAHAAMEENVFTHIDERGAAFFALGLARASGSPAAVICTSGTAAANYLPAILESYYANVPLIIITADRPHELIGIGANQSMRQENLFGNHVQLQVSIPAPSAGMECIRHLQLSAKRLVAAAAGPRPGPVHLNISFREPFLASQEQIDAIPAAYFKPSEGHFFSNDTAPASIPSELAELLKKTRRPCLLFGPGELSTDHKKLIHMLSESTSVPIFAEASSGLGCNFSSPSLLLRFDHYFRSKKIREMLSPDLFIRVGAAPTSKTVLSMLENTQQLVLDFTGEAKNPSLGPCCFLSGSRDGSFHVLPELLKDIAVDCDWLVALQGLESETERALDVHLTGSVFTEWQWMRSSPKYIESGANIFIGNSMQIRDMDAVFPRTKEEHKIFSNRGLSGIDGILSTAIGVASAEHRATHLLVGDITALHDLNALSLAKRLSDKISLTIWLQNNGGGEIFRMVRTAQSGKPNEWFTTPQFVDFAALAKGFGVPFLRATSLADLDGLDASAFSSPGVRIVELLFAGEENMQCRKTFWENFRA